MRAIVALYLVIGIVLLALGFFATGECENKNGDLVNDTVFVLTWPVGIYGYVIAGNMSVNQWLHEQACGGGLGANHRAEAPAQPKPNSGPAPARN